LLTFSPSPERFLVEEIPAYTPAGEGEHTYLWIEKRDLTTPQAIARLASALGVRDRDVGYAGLKDKRATTRQWVSLPRVELDRARAVTSPELRVLEAARHGNKLRVGHLRGNRFEVVLTDDDPAAAGDAAAGAGALAERLRTLAETGVPNRFGEQRFGVAGDNAAVGMAILRGERNERDHRRRRILLSAAQSAVFNRVLERRAESGGLRLVRPGDVLQKTASGGLFVSEDPSVDQPRVDAGEVVPTGPLPGGREVEPPVGSPARALEDAALADVGATRDEFARAGRDLPGARRAVVLAVTLGEPAVVIEPAEPGRFAVRLRFTLPAGGYATVVVAELGATQPGPSSHGRTT
jgi:tRNA pseudouridine13 synthase